MKKLFLVLTLPLLFVGSLRADEGMWLPYYIQKIIGPMKGYGFRLSAEDVYDMNRPGLKDAVVQFGTFCTGEIVSDKGLIFTNHHCGYDAIAELSTTAANYIDDGYWATSFEKELPVPGLTISILVYMQDVTARVQGAADKDAEMEKIAMEIESSTGYKAEVESMFYGSEYFVMVYEIFRDIRFVGAPPSNIGNFGGDTDNWMWPRHTGDFSIFRVYAGADNKPADYSVTNKPYKPKHFLPISLKGVKKDDFAMIMGYPGSTSRYLPVSGVNNTVKTDYPDKIKIIDDRLRIMEEAMDRDEQVRINLASEFASFANSDKYFKGVIRGIKNSVSLENKQLLQDEFTAWVNADAGRKAKYGSVLAELDKIYSENASVTKFSNYLNYGYFSTQMVQFGTNFFQLYAAYQKGPVTKEQSDQLLGEVIAGKEEYFKKFIRSTDQEVFASMLRMAYKDLPKEYQINTYTRKEFIKTKPKGNKDQFDMFAEKVYATSMLASQPKLDAFIAKPDKKTFDADLGIQYAVDLINIYIANMSATQKVDQMETEQMRLFIEGLREFKKDKFFYPDANFTLRLTYGQVKPYIPRDGIAFDYFTTHKGILEKEIPGDKEFNVPAKLKELLVKKDFGRYGENGVLPVNFVANLDITGGNSGSPVINANGELIGIAFDGVWEGMVGDLYWDPSSNRTISVDIRYVLFTIDKFAGAQRLMDELKIVN